MDKSHITSEHPYELTFKSKLLDQYFYVDEMDFINYFVKRKNGQLELANRTLNTQTECKILKRGKKKSK